MAGVHIGLDLEDEAADGLFVRSNDALLGGTIARAVTGAVAEGLQTALSVPLSRIADVRYEGDRLVVEMADGERSPFDGMRSDGDPVLKRLDADAGRRLEAAFDKATGR